MVTGTVKFMRVIGVPCCKYCCERRYAVAVRLGSELGTVFTDMGYTLRWSIGVLYSVIAFMYLVEQPTSNRVRYHCLQ